MFSKYGWLRGGDEMPPMACPGLVDLYKPQDEGKD